MNGLEQRPPHWMVRMNHRVRTLVFLAVLIQLCTHLWQQSPGTTFWLLAMLFLSGSPFPWQSEPPSAAPFT